MGFLRPIYIFLFIFSGFGQMLIGYSGILYHILLTLILIVDLILSPARSNVNLSYILIIILLLSYFIHPSNTIDSLTTNYLLKGLLYMIWALLLPFLRLEEGFLKKFLNTIIIMSFIVIILNLIGFIDHTRTNSNYLTIGLVVGAGMLCSTDIKNTRISLLLFFLLSILSLTISSRGSLILSLLFASIIYINKYKAKAISVITFFVVITIALGNQILNYLSISPWLTYKMTRIFSEGGISEEPRYEIYPQVVNYLIKSINLFGSGFSSSYMFRTSWDSKLPFIESFPLELVLNFGIFGILILLMIKIDYYKIFKRSNILFFLNLYMFLNYSKSWSVYSGLVLIVLLSLSKKIIENDTSGISQP